MSKIFENLSNGYWLFYRIIHIQCGRSLVVKPAIKKDWVSLYGSTPEGYFGEMYGCWNGYSIWMFKRYFFVGVKSKIVGTKSRFTQVELILNINSNSNRNEGQMKLNIQYE